MTRAQRIELLKQIEKDIHICSLESTFLDDAKSCAIHSAIEELEQEPILDKIRAEIENERAFQRAMDEYEIATGLRIALGIINKYKAESEEI